MGFDKIAETILRNPFIYWTYQGLIGGHKARRLFVDKNVKPKSGQKLLDIGCGPGNIIEYLPDLNYIGVDSDKTYIDSALRNYGKKGTFICADIAEFKIPDAGTYDIVMASGIIHHLNDSNSKQFFKVAKRALKPNGRLITVDGCFLKGQHKIAEWLLKNDRGEHIRTKFEYENLAKINFARVNSSIEHNYFNIPYTLIVMECFLH